MAPKDWEEEIQEERDKEEIEDKEFLLSTVCQEEEKQIPPPSSPPKRPIKSTTGLTTTTTTTTRQDINEVVDQHFDKMRVDIYNIKGQCPIAADKFEPAFAFANVHNPDYNQKVLQSVMLTRLLILSGYDSGNVLAMVEKEGKSFFINLDRQRTKYNAVTCSGKQLANAQPQLVAAFSGVMQDEYCLLCKDARKSNKKVLSQQHQIKIPRSVKIEKDFKDPFRNWKRVPASSAG